LQTARTQLGAYRAQADGPAGQGVSDLEHGIEKVSAQLQTLGAADKIRTMWHEVAGWAKRVPGGAQQAANAAQEARAEK
jgi:predicted metallopeptidase